MKEGPDIALLGALIGDPARANILTALMSGKALTASELAAEAGVTVQTASTHLKKLEDAQMINRRKQGRHRYFSLADEDVGKLLETMMGLAAKHGLLRTRTGPKDEALRKARVCYNHLAGDLGVQVYDSLLLNGHLVEEGDDVSLTDTGVLLFENLEVDFTPLKKSRRPLCKACLDWSSRRSHLSGSLGTALLARIYELDWARRINGSRVVAFSPKGEQEFIKCFPV